ncbi:hypothetical protein [Salinispira pacifica]
MKIKCLSVKNPLSYLVCYGIAEVENRGGTTDYRGPIYIHSSGEFSYSGMPDFSRYPMPVIAEFDRFMSEIERLESTGSYLAFAEHGVKVFLRNEDQASERTIREYNLLSDVYNFTVENPGRPFFLTNSIIGRVDLVDVVEDSASEWAEPGAYHWVFSNAVLLKKAVTRVPGEPGVWEHELTDAERRSS